ncbi:UNVERIFIED_CONTAM: hypothetical protein DES50_101673 [Williamsia faeni]
MDVMQMRSVIAEVAGLTGTGLAGIDATDLVVGGTGKVGVTSVTRVLGDHGIRAREWSESGRRAAVALLILDPSSGVSDVEVDVVRRLRDCAPLVAVVCNKIDAYWDWPTLLKVNRGIVDPDGRMPIFAVSAAAALAGHQPESGFGELIEWLDEQVDGPARPERLESLEAERHLDALISELATERGDPAADLLTERADAVASRDRGRSDRLAAVRGGANQIRATAVTELDGAARDLSRESAARASALSRRGTKEFEQWLAGRLTALRDRAQQRFDDARSALESRALLGLEEVGPPPAHPPLPIQMPPVPPRRRGAEEALVVAFGASAGLGLGRLLVMPLSAVDTLQWVAMPLTLLLGAAIAVGLVRLRRLSALRTSMAAWASEAVVTMRGRIEQDIARQVQATESVLGGRLARFYEHRAQTVSDRVAELDAQIRARRRVAPEWRERDLRRLAAAVEARDRLDEVLIAIGH